MRDRLRQQPVGENVELRIDTIDPTTTPSRMAMGKRWRRPTQTSMLVATQDLPRSAAHPFYARMNQILAQADFDGYAEDACPR
jgi:hypothetical protein